MQIGKNFVTLPSNITTMIEKSPKISKTKILEILLQKTPPEIEKAVEKINNDYLYWNDVKYKSQNLTCTAIDLWHYVKASRIPYIAIWEKYDIKLHITTKMQQMCHLFDMKFGGSWGNDTIIDTNNRPQYLISSLMEEAIFSSQMEGATTTRKIAKDMLRKEITPRDKSQQMIYNNYQTIQFILEHKNDDITKELLLTIHRLMTNKTLEKESDAGQFRNNDNVVVENSITHEIVHTPPSHTEINEFINDFCHFFNEKEPAIFIHPIIKGIIIHFMIAFMHPFADGNGRTARALFYWYMLKQDYWLTEYLSISRIIAESKKTYEKAYLYVENDENDLGYFVTYNLRVLDLAFKKLQQYIKRKTKEKLDANQFLHIGEINQRQAQIIKIYYDNPQETLTVKEVQNKFGISPTTAKSDIIELVNRGILAEISFNKVKKGYIKGPEFDTIISKK